MNQMWETAKEFYLFCFLFFILPASIIACTVTAFVYLIDFLVKKKESK